MPAESVVQAPPPVASLPAELRSKSGFVMVQLAMGFKTRAIAAVEAAGFSQYHYGVLAILDEQPRRTQSTIAEALGMDPSQLVGVLDSLEEMGLIARQRDPDDRRRHLVTLTAQGRKQLDVLRAMIDGIEDDLFAPLSDADRATFHDLLLRLAAHHDPRWGPGDC